MRTITEKQKKEFSQEMGEVIQNLESALLIFESDYGVKPDFSIETFRAGVKIFLSVIMDKLFERQDKEDMPIEEREKEAYVVGSEIRNFILKYTGIDSHKLYDKFRDTEYESNV